MHSFQNFAEDLDENVCHDDVEEQESLEDEEDIGESSLGSLKSQNIGNEEVSYEAKNRSSKEKAKKPKRQKEVAATKCSKEQVDLALMQLKALLIKCLSPSKDHERDDEDCLFCKSLAIRINKLQP